MASNKKCSSCGVDNPPTAKFCRGCGTKFPTETPQPEPPSTGSSTNSSSSWGWLSTPAVGYVLYKLIQLFFN